MINFFRKPKVVFECLIPGVEKIMPITPANELKHAWVQKAFKDYREAKSNPEYGMRKEGYTARCPGIFALQRHGWVLRTWQDIVIETYGDGVNFSWSTPIDQNSICPYSGHAVHAHPSKDLADYMDNWDTNTLKSLVKIQTPWRCRIPKGYYLLEMPIPYADDQRFTAVSGFFSSEYGDAQLNPQLLWHVMNGKTLIKAGTPIAQYILVPRDKYDTEIKVIKEAHDQDVYALLNGHRFVRDFGELKRIFGEANDRNSTE